MIEPRVPFMQRRRAVWQTGVLVCALCLMCAALLAPAALLAQDDSTPLAGTVTVFRLNVRAEPNITAAVVGSLAQDAPVQILETNEDGDWYRIDATSTAGVGWVFADYVAAGDPPAAAIPPAAESVEPADTSAGTPVDSAAPAASEPLAAGSPTAAVVPERINVRGGPGTNYAVVSSAANGTRLEVVALSPDGLWYQVRGAGLPDPAWVFASLTVLDGSLDGVPHLARADLPEAAASPTSASAPASPAAAPNVSTGFGYGITGNMWQGDKHGSANLIKQMGFNWVKQQVRWEYAEPAAGAVNWQEMDDIVNTMHGNGINILFSVVTSPLWTRPTLGGSGGPPEDFQLFANFLGAIAGRYCGRLQAIEVWNEQNLRREWEGFPLEPASYMDLLKRSYNAIKGACPAMLVISGATTPAGYSDVAFDDVDYLRGMYQNGLKQFSDGIGIHPSGFANPPSVTFEDWTAGNYDALSHVNHRSFYFLSTLRASRAVMEEFGDTAKKLWPTEFGWGSTLMPFPGYEYEARIDEATQARWSVDAYNIMAGSGYVGVAMLWNLNYPRDTEMGAFAVAGRPAFEALRQMMGR